LIKKLFGTKVAESQSVTFIVVRLKNRTKTRVCCYSCIPDVSG